MLLHSRALAGHHHTHLVILINLNLELTTTDFSEFRPKTHQLCYLTLDGLL